MLSRPSSLLFAFAAALVLSSLGCQKAKIEAGQKHEFEETPAGYWFSTDPQGITADISMGGTFVWSEGGRDYNGTYKMADGKEEMTMTFPDQEPIQVAFQRDGLNLTMTMPNRTVTFTMQ